MSETIQTNPSPLSQTYSTDTQLLDIQKIRAEMEERFHLFEEIQALPPSLLRDVNRRLCQGKVH